MFVKLTTDNLPFYKWPRWVECEMGKKYLNYLMNNQTAKREKELLRNKQLTVINDYIKNIH